MFNYISCKSFYLSKEKTFQNLKKKNTHRQIMWKTILMTPQMDKP